MKNSFKFDQDNLFMHDNGTNECLVLETREEIEAFLEYNQRELTQKEKDSLEEADKFYLKNSFKQTTNT